MKNIKRVKQKPFIIAATIPLLRTKNLALTEITESRSRSRKAHKKNTNKNKQIYQANYFILIEFFC